MTPRYSFNNTIIIVVELFLFSLCGFTSEIVLNAVSLFPYNPFCITLQCDLSGRRYPLPSVPPSSPCVPPPQLPPPPPKSMHLFRPRPICFTRSPRRQCVCGLSFQTKYAAEYAFDKSYSHKTTQIKHFLTVVGKLLSFRFIL